MPPSRRCDRQARDFAGDVPERDVDAGDRFDQHAAGAAGQNLAHAAPEAAAVVRLSPTRTGLSMRSIASRIGGWRDAAEAFAEADDAGIGPDLDEDDRDGLVLGVARALRRGQGAGQGVRDDVADGDIGAAHAAAPDLTVSDLAASSRSAP